MLIKVLSCSVTDVPWLHESSRANFFTCFYELQCLNLTGMTDMLMTSPTVVAAHLNTSRIAFHGWRLFIRFPFVVIWCFLTLKLYNHVNLMDTSLDKSYNYIYNCFYLLTSNGISSNVVKWYQTISFSWIPMIISLSFIIY